MKLEPLSRKEASQALPSFKYPKRLYQKGGLLEVLEENSVFYQGEEINRTSRERTYGHLDQQNRVILDFFPVQDQT